MSEEAIALASQIVGYVAAATIIISFQFKKLRNFYIVQLSGNALWVLSFFLAGRPAGALLNLAGGVRCGLFTGGQKLHRPIVLWSVNLLMVLFSLYSGIFCGDGWLAVLPCAAQIAGSFVMWTGNNKLIRIIQMAVISPLWVAYNVSALLIGREIVWGAVICEAFNVVSALIYLIRTRNNKCSANGAQMAV